RRQEITDHLNLCNPGPCEARMEEILGLRNTAPEPATLPAIPAYEILEVLGEGAMGIVYRAREHRSGRLVALKLMKHFGPDALKRFKEECRTLQKVGHPNLVTLYDVVSDGSRWFFTTELIDGKPFPGVADPGGTVTFPPPGQPPHDGQGNGSAVNPLARPP